MEEMYLSADILTYLQKDCSTRLLCPMKPNSLWSRSSRLNAETTQWIRLRQCLKISLSLNKPCLITDLDYIMNPNWFTMLNLFAKFLHAAIGHSRMPRSAKFLPLCLESKRISKNSTWTITEIDKWTGYTTMVRWNWKLITWKRSINLQ